MKVKLLDFTMLSVPHELFVTDNFPEDAGMPDPDDNILASFHVLTTSVYLGSTLSPAAAVRTFFHEVFELLLSTLGFRYDPYDPHKAFSTYSDVLYGVLLENRRILFQDVLADAFRECVEKYFGDTPAEGVDEDE